LITCTLLLLRCYSTYWLMMVFDVEKRLSVHDGHLDYVGDCPENLRVRVQSMPEGTSQSTPILKPFVVCFVTCMNGRLLAIRKIMSARWRLAVLVSVAIPSVGEVVFTWVKVIYQGIPHNPKVCPSSTGEWTVDPNQFSHLDRDHDLVLYPRSICFVRKPPG
jgi:hypothetical protein